MNPAAAILLAALGACGPRVPPPPPVSSDASVLAPPSQARAAVMRGWHALAAGDVGTARGAAERARQLDPGAAGPLRLAAAVARAGGDAEAAATLLDAALAASPACVACRVDRAAQTRSDADGALAMAAGAAPAAVLRALGGDPGPRTLAAWRERTDLAPAERARRGRALVAAGQAAAGLADLQAAVEAGVADPDTLGALAGAGDAALALWGAGERARWHPDDAAAVRAWFALAWAHGADGEVGAAVSALGALPARRLGGDTPGTTAAAVSTATPPPALPTAAVLWMATQRPDLAARVSVAGVDPPAGARGLALWLRAAAGVGVPTHAVEEAAIGEPALADVVVRHRLARGDVAGAVRAAEAAWRDDPSLGPAGWPAALEAAGAADAAEALRRRAGPTRAAAIAVAEDGPAQLRALVQAGGAAASPLRPLSLLQLGRPCDAVAAFVKLRPGSARPLPGEGVVGYAGANAGCWTAEALPVLRAAQAASPADGRLAHALGRALLDLGDPAGARRPLLQARRALPGDPRLHSDLARLPPSPEDRR